MLESIRIYIYHIKRVEMSSTNNKDTVFKKSEFKRDANQRYSHEPRQRYNTEYNSQDERDTSQRSFRGSSRGSSRGRGGYGGPSRDSYRKPFSRQQPPDNREPRPVHPHQESQNNQTVDRFDQLYLDNRHKKSTIRNLNIQKKKNEIEMNNITCDNYTNLTASHRFIQVLNTGFTLDRKHLDQVVNFNSLNDLGIQILVLRRYLVTFVNKQSNVQFMEVFTNAVNNFNVLSNRIITVRFDDGSEVKCLYFPSNEEITRENIILFNKFGFSRLPVPKTEYQKSSRNQQSHQSSQEQVEGDQYDNEDFEDPEVDEDEDDDEE